MAKQSQLKGHAKLERVLAALARGGLDVTREGPVWSLRGVDNPDGVRAEVLLPDEFPLSSKAAQQGVVVVLGESAAASVSVAPSADPRKDDPLRGASGREPTRGRPW